MGVGELVLIDHKPRGRGALAVGVAALDAAGLVLIRQELRQHVRHRIGAAERADEPRLVQGVLLLLQQALLFFRFPTGPGVGRDVRPICVPGQHGIGIQPRGVDALEQIFPIYGDGRPEHQPLGFVGGVVEVLNAPVECGHPGDGDVLLRRHRTGERYVEPQTRRYRRVLVRGVHGRCEGAEQAHLVPEVHGRKIGVEGQECAVDHGNTGPPSSLQGSPDDPTHVLDAQLFHPGRRMELRKRFRGPGGDGQTLQQLAPLHAHGLPVLIVPAAAARDFDSAIIAEHGKALFLLEKTWVAAQYKCLESGEGLFVRGSYVHIACVL